MHHQDLGHTTELAMAAARDSPAGATAAAAAAEEDDAIPLSDLSPPKRTPEPSSAHAHNDHDDDDGRSTGKRPPIRAHTPHHYVHDHHHRRQSTASVSVSEAVAARGGMSMAFCAAYPFRRLVFQSTWLRGGISQLWGIQSSELRLGYPLTLSLSWW